MLSRVSGTLIDEGVATEDAGSVEGGGRAGWFAERMRSGWTRARPWLAHEDELVDEDGEPGARWQRVVGVIVVAICTFMVIRIIDPHTRLWPIWDFHFGWVFKNTTTNGGDMGAHVWLPWFLEHHWFPKLRLAGWAPDWYAGFPVGQYYFPFPSLVVALLNIVIPYNVAFKIVTVSGPVMLPASAYVFARGLRTPFPTAPAFAIAAFGMLVQERTDWNIYGGNIASTLAGEYSFEIALALALFALGALAYSLDTGQRRWLPAVLIAAAVMSHIVVAIFVGVAAVIIWLLRSPRKTWPLAVAIGAVGLLLTAVWSLPLLGQQAYTQSMRYAKVFSTGSSFKVPYWILLPNPIKHTIEGIVRGVSPRRDTTGKIISPTLWLPWWIWVLAGVAIIAAGWYRRRSTLVLLLVAVCFGVFFVEWPEHAVWNTRFLPFWLLMWGFLAAAGAADIVRLVAKGVAWSYAWISAGDLEDVRARAWADIALDDRADIDPELRRRAVAMLAERQFESGPPGWEPPAHLESDVLQRRMHAIGAGALAALVVVACTFGMWFGWTAQYGNPSIRVASWAQYNYGGYQSLGTSWSEFHDLIQTMDKLPPGRALWEGGNAVGAYGTTLSPELLPYFTNGRIDSMEGLYFESSATVPFHFMTVSELAQSPSNPVRGLVYGSAANPSDFALGVKHLQMLGVSYLMVFSGEAKQMAAQQPDLQLVATVPDFDGQAPFGWNIYQVKYPGNENPLVTGLSEQPVVATVHAGTYNQCWNQQWTDPSPMPELGPWECAAAPWWLDAPQLDKVWTASGPKDWTRIDIKDLAKTSETPITPTKVSDIHEDVDSISFHVSEIGKPVLVRTSFFPNWQAHGAEGPYRVAPNFMVVVPTSKDVSLTYGLTKYEWLGRVGTVLGIVGVGLLIGWKGLAQYGAIVRRNDEPSSGEEDEGEGEGETGDGGDAAPGSASDDPEPREVSADTS
jgi:hypothetical protein